MTKKKASNAPPLSMGPDLPLTGHLSELRNRLLFSCGCVFLGVIACFLFKEALFHALVIPVVQQDAQLVFTAVPEMFFTYLRLSFYGGLFLGFPVILWQLWRFIAPGLYETEKNIVGPLLFFTPFLFYGGGAFTYFIVMPLVVDFFFQFQTPDVSALPSVKEYLNFFIKMLFAFGLAFELPLALILFMRAGIIKHDTLRTGRKYAFVGIFILAALLTPPDPASQMLLALPMLLLYELALVLGRPRKKGG